MSLGSLLAASEPDLSPGEEAVVCVAVATMWASPGRVRPVDAPAVGVPARARSWIMEMSDQDRADLDGRTLTQLLLGERVRVLQMVTATNELTPYGALWAQVVALSQPSSLDPRGYPGWIPLDQLSSLGGIHVAGVRVAARHRSDGVGDDRTGVLHVVEATATTLRDDPDGALVVPGVTLGTRLIASGAPHDGWVPVAVPGRFEPAWAIEHDLVPVPPTPPEDHAEVLAMADRLREVPYVWGGVCAYGVDCSGLVHLAWRRFGVTLPRDAHDQAAATTQIPLGQERPGDLYFFARPGQRVHHVGFVADRPVGDTRVILHACARAGMVVVEELTGERAETLTGAHRMTGGVAGF